MKRSRDAAPSVSPSSCWALWRSRFGSSADTVRGPVHPGIRDIWHAPARTQRLTIELSRALDQSRSSKGMSFWSLFFRERSIAYKLETFVQRPWFVTPFRPRHLSYLHLIGKNNAIPEISIGTTHLLPTLAPLISPHLEQMPHSARSPASELGDLRWRHEVGIGFERRQVEGIKYIGTDDGRYFVPALQAMPS